MYNILTLSKFNIITCMKVTGETFSFIFRRKGAEEARYNLYRNFQAKVPLPDNYGELGCYPIILN